MSTTTVPDAARLYLDQVRDGLADLLADGEAEEVLQDLEAHLAEIDPAEIEATLGAPSEFLAEFRSSAGLDVPGEAAGGSGLARAWRRASSRARQVGDWGRRTVEPVLAPLVDHRSDIRTAWVWSRGILAVVAAAWAIDTGTYGTHHVLFPRDSGLIVQLAVLALATFLSVRLGAADGRWWSRLDVVASLAAAYLIVLAVSTPQYIPYPEEQGFIYPEAGGEGGAPVLLIGPNGPIQNLHAYDIDGNPVDVLLYDGYGNPIQTLPQYAYEEAIHLPPGEPFIWEGYEIRFRTDIYDRPVGNLYPLERYEWTETGARSAPQPPPVVGIPEMSVNTPESGLRQPAPGVPPVPADGG